MPKHTLLSFCGTDGTSSVWPNCGRLPDGGALDRLFPNDEYTVQFLGKLATHLAGLLSYPGAYHMLLSSSMQSSITDSGRTDGESIEIASLPDGYGLFN